MTRNRILEAALAAALALAGPGARAADDEIRVGACQPITGRFAFAGVNINAGLQDYLAYANEQGLVKGKKLAYFYEDSGYDTDKAVATFKKIMAQHAPVIMYGESTRRKGQVQVETIVRKGGDQVEGLQHLGKRIDIEEMWLLRAQPCKMRVG